MMQNKRFTHKKDPSLLEQVTRAGETHPGKDIRLCKPIRVDHRWVALKMEMEPSGIPQAGNAKESS